MRAHWFDRFNRAEQANSIHANKQQRKHINVTINASISHLNRLLTSTGLQFGQLFNFNFTAIGWRVFAYNISLWPKNQPIYTLYSLQWTNLDLPCFFLTTSSSSSAVYLILLIIIQYHESCVWFYLSRFDLFCQRNVCVFFIRLFNFRIRWLVISQNISMEKRAT